MKLLAERNGHQRYFTKTQWEVLGTDKYGWVLVPAEVAIDMAKTPQVGVLRFFKMEEGQDPDGGGILAISNQQIPKPKRRKK